ncbi:MAG: HAD family hydrolase, partial [Muribaculaceae bacterium]|nr:HAD family hydrolase [Muribaculaceae bacterium]
MAIRNIIFDFDGTLVDTAPVILATMSATFEELGLPAPSPEKCKSTIGLRLHEIPSKLFPDQEGLGEIYAETYRRLFNTYNTLGAIVTFDGVRETLTALKRGGFNMAIASSRHRKSIEEIVGSLNMSALFDKIIGGDNVINGKPSPEPVLTITDSMQWLTEETLVVGDAGVDIIMGKSAGCMTCGVTYGNGTIDELKVAGTDYIIGSFAEVQEVVRLINHSANHEKR